MYELGHFDFRLALNVRDDTIWVMINQEISKLKLPNKVKVYELGHFDLGLDLSVRDDTMWVGTRKKLKI